MKIALMGLPSSYDEKELIESIINRLVKEKIVSNIVVIKDTELLSTLCNEDESTKDSVELVFCKELKKQLTKYPIRGGYNETILKELGNLVDNKILTIKQIVDLSKGKYNPYLEHIDAMYIVKYAKLYIDYLFL